MDKPTIFSDNPLDKISKTINFKAGEHFTFSSGEWSGYSESQHTALVDFNLYETLIEFIKQRHQKPDGSYEIGAISLGSSVDFNNVLNTFLEIEDEHKTQRYFIEYLNEHNYIKPLNTKNVYLGSFPYFEISGRG